MAFNPFHKFRKHQRVIFAVLTIICMLAFVGSSGMFGGGDFFHWLQETIVGRVRSADAPARLDGADVTASEMIELARQREIANMYMSLATELALQGRMQEISPQTAGDKQRLTPDVLQKLFRDPEVMILQQRLNNRPYFGGNWSPEGLIDFKLWLKQADNLKIKLSPDDVRVMVNAMTFNRITRADSRKIEEVIGKMLRERHHLGFTPTMLMAALTSEFRAQLAQAAIVGLDPITMQRMPAPATPEQFWNFYREGQTQLKVQLIPVAVEDFLSQVTQVPSDDQLEKLYEQYKNREYEPDSKEPGFKQPRRIEVEWISGRASSPFYQQAAVNFRYLEPLAQGIAMLACPPAPLAGITPAIQFAAETCIDARLFKEYDDTRWRNFRAPSYVHAWRWPPYPIHESNLENPLNTLAALGAGTGNAAPLDCFTAFLGTAVYKESEARVLRGTTWILSGSQPTPLMAAAVAAQVTPADEYIPFSRVRNQVNQGLMTYLSQELLAVNMQTIAREVEATAKTGDHQRLKDYIARTAPKFDFRFGSTVEPRDQHRNKIDTDPGLKPLRDAYTRPPSRDPEGKNFHKLFFGSPIKDAKDSRDLKGPFQVDRLPATPFVPAEEDTVWKSAPESFMFWKSSDHPAEVAPLTNPKVRDDVTYAWRFQKARELARKHADELAGKVRDQKGDPQKLRDLAAQHRRRVIELPPLAKLMQRQSIRAEVAFSYDPPRENEELAKVPHAGPDFATQLLTFREKNKGDALVVPDKAERNYYVAVLVDREVPTLDAFFRTYRDGATDAIRRDPLLQIFVSERQVQYFKDLVEMMRAQADYQPNEEKMKGLRSTLVGPGE